MRTRESAQAQGFDGLRHFVSDVDAIIERCRLEGAVGAARTREVESPTPALIVDTDARLQAFSPARIEPRPAAATDAPRRGGRWSALASVAVVLATGAATLFGMQALQQREAAPPLEAAALHELEALPPPGRGLLLKPAQIRYCIAQGIRLAAAAAPLEAPSQSTPLAVLYRDYDSRCAEYRFQAGAFDRARRAVEARRAELERQGQALLATVAEVAPAPAPMPPAAALAEPIEQSTPAAAPAAPSPTPPAAAPAARKLVKDLQWRLFKLRFYHGPIDGVDSAATRRALRGFFSVHPAVPDPDDEQQVFQAVDDVYRAR